MQWSYLARGAIPLAVPYLKPSTTTGTPQFPAATEATWLRHPNDFYLIILFLNEQERPLLSSNSESDRRLTFHARPRPQATAPLTRWGETPLPRRRRSAWLIRFFHCKEPQLVNSPRRHRQTEASNLVERDFLDHWRSSGGSGWYPYLWSLSQPPLRQSSLLLPVPTHQVSPGMQGCTSSSAWLVCLSPLASPQGLPPVFPPVVTTGN